MLHTQVELLAQAIQAERLRAAAAHRAVPPSVRRRRRTSPASLLRRWRPAAYPVGRPAV